MVANLTPMHEDKPQEKKYVNLLGLITALLKASEINEGWLPSMEALVSIEIADNGEISVWFYKNHYVIDTDGKILAHGD